MKDDRIKGISMFTSCIDDKEELNHQSYKIYIEGIGEISADIKFSESVMNKLKTEIWMDIHKRMGTKSVPLPVKPKRKVKKNA